MAAATVGINDRFTSSRRLWGRMMDLSLTVMLSTFGIGDVSTNRSNPLPHGRGCLGMCVKEVKITLPDGTEYVGPPLDEPCDECGVPAGVPCLPDPGEYEEDDR